MEQIIVTHVDGSTLRLQSKENVSNITKAVQNVEKLGADTVDVSVSSATKLTFSIGDKITVFGRDYTLNAPANEKKISEANFSYDLQFEGVQYDLLRASYSVNVDTTSGKVQDLNGDNLTGDIKMFLDVLIANANRVFPGKWILGTYPLGSETRTETFGDADNCLTVLQSLCGEDKYNTEFSIAIGVGGVRTINIGATGNTHTYTFEYGKGKGLNELVREKQSSSNIITRLNVYGSSKNINTSKYRAFKLCLPEKTKSQSYLENNDSIAAYGVWEGTKVFDDVYPHRIGVISAVGSSELIFTDSSMDFDLNEKDGEATKYLINGSSAKVHFNSGALAGYEFDLLSYNHATKLFTVKPITDENGYTFPSPTSSAFQFAVGDKYVLLDIYLPQAYIDAAENDLEVKGQEYLDKYSQPLVQYGLKLDSSFLLNIVGADAESNIIWPGDFIPIKDIDLNVDKPIRVKGISRNLLADYDYNITISDLGTKVSTITRIISSISGIDKLIRINGLNDPARARRNYLSAQEVLSMIFDTEGDFYTDKIKPLSIETSMLSVGAKSMQFDLTGTVLNPNYGGAKNRIVYVGGTLSHSAILDVSNNPRSWNITDGDVVLSTDAAYYIYAKCIKVGAGASLLFSLSKITAESDPNYYHFLIGVANSVNTNNARSIALMYGFSAINGRFINAGRIQSPDGVTYFDLDSGEIGGNIKFKAGSSGYDNLTDKPDLSVFAEKTYVDAVKGDLQDQIDGVVDSWFYNYTPSVANAPASEWTTTEIKQRHVGDTFTNTQPFVDNDTTPDAGKSWRWVNNSGVFSWTPIADSDAVKALLEASKAQDTADGKRRVFTAQPTAPYDAGDLWAKGTAIYKCDVPKLEGQAFAAEDWSVTATDDTAVNNLQIGGRNLIRDSKGEFLGSSQVYEFVVKNPALSNVAGKTFTLSAEACVTEAGNDTHVGLFAFNATWQFSVGILSGVNNGSWEHISVTFTVPSDFSGDVIVGAYNSPSGNGGSVALRYLKLEEGNKATGWTPAPEDVQADITTAQDVANASAQKITDMAADGKITPVEKKSLSQLVDQAMSEVNDLVDQADAYGVFRDTYQDTYYDLLSFTGPFLSDMLATSDVVRATLEQMFSSYNYAKVALLNNISNAINGTATTAKNAADDAAIIARAMSSGKMLNRDPNFKSGWNGINYYNNNGGTALVVSRNAAESDSPNYPDGFDVKLSYVGGSSGTQPGLGGFTFATQCRANAVFLVRIIAYIPVGYSIEWTSNAFGTGGTQRRLTTTNGEGKFKEYLLLVRCGSSGTFSTTNFFYLTGPTASVNWWLCFATVYDTTSSEAYVTDAFDYLKEAMANDTNVTGGLIATSILKLGAVNQAGTWIEKAGISGVGSGNVPRVWTGGALQNAINRISGNKTIPMFVATEEGEFFADKGEVGGFDITPQGIEKEQSITDNGVTFTGKFALDWMNQAINFFRDGVARVLVSAKAITSGIPTPTDITVATGTWKDLKWFTAFYGQTIGDTSILGPRNILTPGGYTAKNTLNVFLNVPQWAEGEVPTWQCYLNVTLNVWKTDAANAKIGLICSTTKSVSLNDSLLGVTLPVSFSLEVSTGISHEIYVSGNDTSYTTLDGYKTALRCDRGQTQVSMVYAAQSESFEIGYSGFRIMATNLWCYFNTKDNANKHFRMRGNAELVSKNALNNVAIDDTSFRADMILLQGLRYNLVLKTTNYAMLATDKKITGYKIINPTVDVTITLPDLNAYDVVDGVNNYYNDNRVIMVMTTTRNAIVAPFSGQTVRRTSSQALGTDLGRIFVGDRTSLNWLML